MSIVKRAAKRRLRQRSRMTITVLATMLATVPLATIPLATDGFVSGGEPKTYPPVPQMVTSFGAAIAGERLYMYGGHTGRAHHYSREAQEKQLVSLDLKNGRWETVAEGPGLQGLALVSHGEYLYRIGGFTAKNDEGEEHELWSQSAVARYSIRDREWTEMPPLPESRSSFDAAVLGDSIYVIGGWSQAGRDQAGEDKTTWLGTAWRLDLAQNPLRWEQIAAPPFKRRALSVAAHDRKIYVVGGMQERGGPTTQVAIFDPQDNAWSEGPSLIGEPMNGFGSSSFAVENRLYVSTYDGSLQRLSHDGQSFEAVEKLTRARFFHRMLPLPHSRVIIVGGASMQEGKFAEVDVVELPR